MLACLEHHASAQCKHTGAELMQQAELLETQAVRNKHAAPCNPSSMIGVQALSAPEGICVPGTDLSQGLPANAGWHVDPHCRQ